MKLGVTGHRPQKMFGFSEKDPKNSYLINSIGSFIKKKNPKVIYTGMALGTDIWAAQWAISYGIPFIAVLPGKNPETRWTEKSQKKFRLVIEKASDIIVAEKENDRRSYSELCQARNEMIVDLSDEMMAVYGGGIGGTKNCLDYARANNKKITVINPGDYYSSSTTPA